MDKPETRIAKKSPPLRPDEAARKPRKISSLDLLGDQTELLIEHRDSEYRLRITSQGKLILTK